MMVTLYDYDALQKRIAELEAENERLRGELQTLKDVHENYFGGQSKANYSDKSNKIQVPETEEK